MKLKKSDTVYYKEYNRYVGETVEEAAIRLKKSKHSLVKKREKMRVQTKINIFVPALALQHSSNPEGISRREQLELAVMRYFLNKDFYNPTYRRPAPYVFLEKFLFKKNPLGYAVSAIVEVEKPVENPVN